ncbi:Dyp-type peroxidase [Formicincola oecophyllae]|uniref:Dyp-type peroxidase n=1 Tax=Formicincola oecophyllae TaxID=2558361 RepID=A0A4Y6UAI5_9PROT|nr:Dyp-type peroxidase [Formicincola oecophyllae]QDH13950.1 Dyp-type peroxidase [Formicincola oecophyllae]
MAQAPLPQAVAALLTPAAVFLVLSIKPGKEAEKAVRATLANMSALGRTVRFRNLHAEFTCVTGISAPAWKRLFPDLPHPKHLHKLQPIDGPDLAAPCPCVSTPGDLLFHIRADQPYMCMEMAMLIMDELRPHVTTDDETHGFKYFDDRDLLGFVDGTENPEGPAAVETVMVTADEDPNYVNSSYVIVQKYLHNLEKWNSFSVEKQEGIIGRHKLSNVELPDDKKPPYAHNVLNVIEKDGVQINILRDNMPFGFVGDNKLGTYYIAYAKNPATTEEMLHNMFVGRPKGTYDHILDVSTPITGTLFFIPTQDFLDNVQS